MMRGLYVVVFGAVIALTGCTSAQYGYDDVYDHDYPLAVKTQPSDQTTSSSGYHNYNRHYDSYDEDGYQSYDRNSSSRGYYSSRLRRFYGPSLSISYYSGCYSPNWYNSGYHGYNSYGYNPWNSYNAYNYDPYYWHLQHYHGYNNWSNPWYGYNSWNNFGYGYGYGYHPYYGSYQPYVVNNYYGYGGYHDYPATNPRPTHYGPRPNYSGFSNATQPANSQNYGTPNDHVKQTIFDNGVQVKTITKDAPLNDTSTPSTTPSTTPRNYTAPQPQSTPRPRYNAPRSTTAPRTTSPPRTAPAPAHPSPQPRTSPSVAPQPRSSGSSSGSGGVKVKTIKKD